MSHLSPCVYLLWAILTTCLGGFYFHHLWKFDRFRCLDITRRQGGAFKRVMTYSYLIAVPMLLTYTVAFAVIKYQEGFIILPSRQLFPKPYQLWSSKHQAALFPLCIVWALAWGAEAVSHLEELCFWLYLIHAGPTPTSWFRSIYFNIWMGGSSIAVILAIIVAIATKDDPLRNEASLQFVGSTISLLITIGFLPILWVFPNFIQTVRDEGAEMSAVIRLVIFHELNITRIFFRFLFVVPLFILAVDGLRPHTHTLNENMMWTDFLSMASGVGCVVQSLITLMIFFPRNVEEETQRWLREAPLRSRRFGIAIPVPKVFKGDSKLSSHQSQQDTISDPRPKYLLTDSPISSNIDLPPVEPSGPPYTQSVSHYGESPQPHSQLWSDGYTMAPLPLREPPHHPFPPVNTRSTRDTQATPLRLNKPLPQINPLALNFTSPIDLIEGPHRRTGR